MHKQVSFDDESLILVNKQGLPIGSKPKLDCHLGDGLLHKAFSVFIINAKSEVLLQQRSAEKLLWPLYWSNSCCSHPRLGEEEGEAVPRRLLEELGICANDLTKHFDFEYVAKYKDVGTEHEICSVFTAYSDDEILVNPSEIAEWKWVGLHEMTALLEKEGDAFTPWIKLEWKRLYPMLS